jgi:hypothetical protein
VSENDGESDRDTAIERERMGEKRREYGLRSRREREREWAS